MNFLPDQRSARPGRAVVRIAGLIDLVFLLLAFFLVTSALLEGESSVAAGLGASGTGEVAVPPVVVEVHAKAWRLGVRTIRDPDELRAALAAVPRGPGVVIRPTVGASSGDLVVTVREARAAGVERLTLETGP